MPYCRKCPHPLVWDKEQQEAWCAHCHIMYETDCIWLEKQQCWSWWVVREKPKTETNGRMP